MRFAVLFECLSTLLLLVPLAAAEPDHTPVQLGGKKPETTCWMKGWRTTRRPVIAAVDEFCNGHQGELVTGDRPVEAVSPFQWMLYLVEIYMDVKAEQGVGWTVDAADCMRMFRAAVDGCNTDQENKKQGGKAVAEHVAFSIHFVLQREGGYKAKEVQPDVPDVPPDVFKTWGW